MKFVHLDGYFLAVIEGFFFKRDQNKCPFWRMALIGGRNRVEQITAFKKETDWGFSLGRNWRMAVIEVGVLEGFYCILIYIFLILLTEVWMQSASCSE